MAESFIELDLFINGNWQPSVDGGRIEDYNPSTGELAATVARAGPKDLDQTVEAAKRGLTVWRDTHPAERGRILYRIANEIRARSDQLVQLETLDTGGAVKRNKNSVENVCARRFEYYAGLADKIMGDTFVAPNEYFTYTLREPKGVTAHIIPWNSPLWIGSRSIAPALAAGNAVIVKPSSEAPLSLLKLAELACDCGLPPGVMNVITGTGSELGEAIACHPDIDAIYFTGSGETAKKVLEHSSSTFMHTVMELGGKSPNIVMPDADLDSALTGSLWGIFANSGQICIAGSRLFVHAEIHDSFVERLTKMVRKLSLGGPDTQADLGPMISDRQRESVLSYVETGREEAHILTGGGIPEDLSLQRGYFIQPTIFDFVPAEATIATDEIFGPVLAVSSFDDIDEVIGIANASNFGLAAAVWTSNLQTAHIIGQRLESAMVFINHYFNLGYEVTRTPYKRSGFGHSEGPQAIDEFLNTKSVSINMKT